ncbi:MAG: beta-CASP ribonuclease aCPSF1, partial [Candidatus Thermoplasmatota archaeon]
EKFANSKITKIIPQEAGIKDIYFDAECGEVTIEALQPNLAIGKYGSVLNELKREIGWAPRVVRAPPIPSKIVKDVREYLKKEAFSRKEALRKIGKRIHREISGDETWIRATALGGFREVGRSALLVTTKDSKVMVDCGINVADESPPYLQLSEVLPLDSIDAVVVTHAHLDHAGLVPLLYKYGYTGPTYCTLPTRDLSALLQLDYLKVVASENKKIPYESANIRDFIKHCVTLRYGDTTDITPDLRLTYHNAGHILGSCIAHLHVGEGLHNIAVTGDIKYERTWLFNSAINRFPRVETLVLEATYGGKEDIQPTRAEATEQLKQLAQSVLNRKGKLLIPVFAVGRSQEVMMVIENLISNKELPEVPVYLDGMIWEATAIHTAYPEFLNTQLRNAIFQKGENPFLSDIFKRVDSTEKRETILSEVEPCIVLATAGMLNGGPVMEYLKAWCSEPKNMLVFVGYQAEGTLGRRIQKGLRELEYSYQGKTTTLKIEMQIETCDGFSGHSDRRQLLSYVHHMEPKPERIIIAHGEYQKCIDLASSIYKKYGIDTRAPMNLETVRIK